MLNDVLLINPVVSEMFLLGYPPILRGQTPITALGENIYLCVFQKDGRTSELAPGMLVIRIVLILKTVSCGLAATG